MRFIAQKFVAKNPRWKKSFPSSGFVFRILLLISAFFSSLSPVLGVPEQETEERRRNLERFWMILERSPRRGTALDRVFEFYQNSGQIEELLELSRNATSEKAGDFRSWLFLGLILSKNGQEQAATSAFQKAHELQEEDFYAAFYLGESLANRNLYPQAAEVLEPALKNKVPTSSDLLAAMQLLGKIYVHEKDFEKFDVIWKNLGEIFPKESGIYVPLLEILDGEKHYEKALNHYSRLLEGSWDDPEIRLQYSLAVAGLKGKLNREQEAIDDFESLLKKNLGDARFTKMIFEHLDRFFQEKHDPRGQVEFYEKIVQTHPGESEPVLRFSKILLRENQSEKADDLLKNRIEKFPTEISPRLARIEVLKHGQKFEEVDSQYEFLEKNHPENTDFSVQRGLAILENPKLGDKERKKNAKIVWMKIPERFPGDVSKIVTVADLCAAAGLPEDAEKLYKTGAKRFSGDPLYGDYLRSQTRLENLIQLYNRSGNESSTVDFYTRTLLEQPTLCDRPDVIEKMFGKPENRSLREVEILAQAFRRLENPKKQGDREKVRRSLQLQLERSKISSRYFMELLERCDPSESGEEFREIQKQLEPLIEGDAAKMLQYAEILSRKNFPEKSLDWKNLAFHKDPERFFENAVPHLDEYQRKNRIREMVEMIQSTDPAILIRHSREIPMIIVRMMQNRNLRETAMELLETVWNTPGWDQGERLAFRIDLLRGMIWDESPELFPYYKQIVLELIEPVASGEATPQENPHRILAWSSDSCRSLSSVMLLCASEEEIFELKIEVQGILREHEKSRENTAKFVYASILQSLLDLKTNQPESALRTIRRLERSENAAAILLQCGAILGQEFSLFEQPRYLNCAVMCFENALQITREGYGEVYLNLRLLEVRAKLRQFQNL